MPTPSGNNDGGFGGGGFGPSGNNDGGFGGGGFGNDNNNFGPNWN